MGALFLSIAMPENFQHWASAANKLVVTTFGLGFSSVAFSLVVISALVMLSPLRKVRIGGKHAKPLFGYWKWFAIVLCTTVATGILFWGTAEPIYHFMAPPQTLGIEPHSEAAAIFSLSTLYLHWSFTPYAIYVIPALAFALSYYNHGSSFSLSSMLRPLVKGEASNSVGTILDMACLFALVMGMSASLGAGILVISEGITAVAGWAQSNTTLLLTTLLIVGSFVLSAASGLFKGIQFLSTINLYIFFGLLIFLLVFGSVAEIMPVIGESLQQFASGFLRKSFFNSTTTGDPWPNEWTVFYWANWMAWAPVTALFLGRLAKGYTVGQFMSVTWILPSVFALLWMSLFGGIVLNFELNNTADFVRQLQANGPDSLIYFLFEQLPYARVVVPIFLLTVFLSYVTAADSNTDAIGNLCLKAHSETNSRAQLIVKIIWGLTIGLVSYVMISNSGIEGIKTLSNLGGVPALILLVFTAVNIGGQIYRSSTS